MRHVRVWFAALYLTVGVAVAGVLGFAAVGIVRPDLIFAWGGRLVPGLGALGMAVVLGIVARLLVATQLEAFRDAPSQPFETDAERADRRMMKMASVRITAGQAAAVLVPFGVFAALAVGITMLPGDGINLMTTDPEGHVYLHAGDRLVVADPSGTIVTDTDVKRLGVYGDGVCDMTADEDGNVYFADSQRSYVTVLDRNGRFLRRLDLAGMVTPRLLVGVCGSGTRAFVVAGREVVAFDEYGARTRVAETDLRYPSGIAVSEAGQVLVADSDNARIVSVQGSSATTVADFSSLKSERRYPTDVRIGPDGTVFAVLRKRDPGRPPVFWRGRLYALDDGVPRAVDLREGDATFDVLSFGMLPDGRFMFVPLGRDALYVGDASGRIEPWEPRGIGPRLRAMWSRDVLVSWGPTLSLTLGIAFAMLGFGVMLSRATRRDAEAVPGPAWPPGPPADAAPRIPGRLPEEAEPQRSAQSWW